MKHKLQISLNSNLKILEYNKNIKQYYRNGSATFKSPQSVPESIQTIK